MELTAVWELVMLMGANARGLRVKDLARGLARDPGSGSRLYGEGVAKRRKDPVYVSVAALVEAAVRTAAPLKVDRD